MGGDRRARRSSRPATGRGPSRQWARSRPLLHVVIAAVLVGNGLTRSGSSDALFYAGAGPTLLGGGGAMTLLVLWLVDHSSPERSPAQDAEDGARGPRCP